MRDICGGVVELFITIPLFTNKRAKYSQDLFVGERKGGEEVCRALVV